MSAASIKRWAAANLEKRRAHRTKWRLANPDYSKKYRTENKVSVREAEYAWRRTNPDKVAINRARDKAKATRARTLLKQAVVCKYGGKCTCCGESELIFLAIDHINGGGRKHRREVGKSSIAFYQYLLREPLRPDLYRILCHNCNFAAWATGGKCPHQQERAVAS